VKYLDIEGSEIYDNVRAIVDKDGVSLFSDHPFFGGFIRQSAHYEIREGKLVREIAETEKDLQAIQ
jgi:hypothetical protein